MGKIMIRGFLFSKKGSPGSFGYSGYFAAGSILGVSANISRITLSI